MYIGTRSKFELEVIMVSRLGGVNGIGEAGELIGYAKHIFSYIYLLTRSIIYGVCILIHRALNA